MSTTKVTTPDTVHVTAIKTGGVFGHETKYCDDAGCAGVEYYYSRVQAADVAVNNCYEFDPATGRIIVEII